MNLFTNVQMKQLINQICRKIILQENFLFYFFFEVHIIKIIIGMRFKVKIGISKNLNSKQLDFSPLNLLCVYYVLASNQIKGKFYKFV